MRPPPDLAPTHAPCPCAARCAHANLLYAHAPQGKKLDLRSANPLGALNLLLGRPGIMRGSAVAYFLVWLGNACINSQFGNYVNHLFGWGPQESAPLLVPAASDPQTRTRALAPGRWSSRPPPRASAPLARHARHAPLAPAPRAQVLVGVMIAIAPPALVPHLGLKRSIEYGAVVYALGLLCTAFAHSPLKIIASTLLTSVGCICIPALVAFIANQAVPAERGALLGALETLQALPPSPGVGEPEAQTLTTFALALAPPLCSTPDLSPSPNLAGALPRHRSLELRPDVRLLDLRRCAAATARRSLPRGKRVHAGRARRHPSGLRHVPRGGGQLLLMVARRRARPCAPGPDLRIVA